jgi:hypothetical protein
VRSSFGGSLVTRGICSLVLKTVDESPSFFEPVERCSKALFTDASIRSSVVSAVSPRLVLENTRLLSGRLSCLLTISATLSMKIRKEMENVVHFGGPGGEIY